MAVTLYMFSTRVTPRASQAMLSLLRTNMWMALKLPRTMASPVGLLQATVNSLTSLSSA